MIRLEWESDGLWLDVIDDEDSGHPLDENGSKVSFPAYGYRIRVDDPDALAKAVRETIMPWIAEREAARASMPANWGRASGDDGYDLSDPKHPDFHSVHSDLWDNRDKTKTR